MAYGDKKDFNKEVKPDDTPSHQYIIKLSDRDTTALKGLKGRNGAGMTVGGGVENIAIWKMINQVCEK